MEKLDSGIVATTMYYISLSRRLTDLEKDIVASVDAYNRKPFNRAQAELLVTANNSNYMEIFKSTGSDELIDACVNGPGKVCRDVEEMLFIQIEAMCFREYKLIMSM